MVMNIRRPKFPDYHKNDVNFLLNASINSWLNHDKLRILAVVLLFVSLMSIAEEMHI